MIWKASCSEIWRNTANIVLLLDSLQDPRFNTPL
jgi:hypothetical protein